METFHLRQFKDGNARFVVRKIMEIFLLFAADFVRQSHVQLAVNTRKADKLEHITYPFFSHGGPFARISSIVFFQITVTCPKDVKRSYMWTGCAQIF